MTIDFALLIGFKLPANFNYPYLATSITEFWYRWHISLSTWFRDYLYFPLSGSKNGKFNAYKNIFIVFVLSGIWHRVGLGFLIWGTLHGIFSAYMKIFKPLRWVVTFVLVMVAWSYFRLEFADANVLVMKMFGFLQKPFSNTSPYYVAVIFCFS
ncbi:MAG: MBOAT family O-acyltransferase [Campylobacter sp.]